MVTRHKHIYLETAEELVMGVVSTACLLKLYRHTPNVFAKNGSGWVMFIPENTQGAVHENVLWLLKHRRR